MKLLFFCPRWGSEHLSWDEFGNKVKHAGYDGIEAGVSFDEKERLAQLEALNKYDLKFIGQYWQSFEKNFNEHRISYKKHLEHLATLYPIKIDSQTGKDYFSFEENATLFELAEDFSFRTGIPVAHETHRNKALFAAHITKKFLEQIPSLTITADFSHWCNVAESFLEDQEEAIDIAVEHSMHIHARVGHAQSAQVIDPRLPEWKQALQYHLSWWERIIQYQNKSGAEYFTITPEFGPAPYMIHHLITKEPLADQWEINCWMMDYLRANLYGLTL